MSSQRLPSITLKPTTKTTTPKKKRPYSWGRKCLFCCFLNEPIYQHCNSNKKWFTQTFEVNDNIAISFPFFLLQDHSAHILLKIVGINLIRDSVILQIDAYNFAEFPSHVVWLVFFFFFHTIQNTSFFLFFLFTGTLMTHPGCLLASWAAHSHPLGRQLFTIITENTSLYSPRQVGPAQPASSEYVAHSHGNRWQGKLCQQIPLTPLWATRW